MDMGSRWEIKSYAVPLKWTKDNQRASHHCHTHSKTPKKQQPWCPHTLRQQVNNRFGRSWQHPKDDPLAPNTLAANCMLMVGQQQELLPIPCIQYQLVPRKWRWSGWGSADMSNVNWHALLASSPPNGTLTEFGHSAEPWLSITFSAASCTRLKMLVNYKYS